MPGKAGKPRGDSGERRTPACCQPTEAPTQSPGKASAAPHAKRWGDHLVTFPSPGDLQQHARVPDTSMYPPCTSLHSWRAPCSLLPRQHEPTRPNWSENIPWVPPELAVARWSHIPLMLAHRQARKCLTTDSVLSLPQPTPKPSLMASPKDTSSCHCPQKCLGIVPQLQPLRGTLTSARAAWGGSCSPSSSQSGRRGAVSAPLWHIPSRPAALS